MVKSSPYFRLFALSYEKHTIALASSCEHEAAMIALGPYGTSHDYCNSSVYSPRVKVTLENLRYTLDIEFFNYIY